RPRKFVRDELGMTPLRPAPDRSGASIGGLIDGIYRSNELNRFIGAALPARYALRTSLQKLARAAISNPIARELRAASRIHDSDRLRGCLRASRHAGNALHEFQRELA